RVRSSGRATAATNPHESVLGAPWGTIEYSPRQSRLEAGRRMHYVVWRIQFRPPLLNQQGLQDPLPEHVPGHLLVAAESAGHDGGDDLRFHEGIRQHVHPSL